MSELTVDTCDCDVLVVGGGLVGLAASMFRAQKGVRVSVVERRARPRAIPSCAVSAPERWSCIGPPESKSGTRRGREPFLCCDRRAPLGEYERVHLPLALARQNRLSPPHYACDQDRLEPILLQRSAELGAQLFYGCTAVNIEQHESAVTADVVWSHPLSARARQQCHRVGSPPDTWLPRTVPGHDPSGLGIGRHGQPVPDEVSASCSTPILSRAARTSDQRNGRTG
jgi:hypothetical protein